VNTHLFLYCSVIVLLAFSSVAPLTADTRSPYNRTAAVSPGATTTTTSIHVSSFHERQEAEKEVSRLKAHGAEAMFRYEKVKGKGMWYRVYVGRFKNGRQARAYAQSLKDRGVITWSWVKTITLPRPAGPDSSSSRTKARAPAKALPEAAAASVKIPTPSNPPSTVVARAVNPPAGPAAPPPDLLTRPSPGTQPAAAKAEEPEGQGSPEQESSHEEAPSALAEKLKVKSQTTLRAFERQSLERDTNQGEDALVLPFYQYLQLDYGDAEEAGWSFHMYGWGRTDLADSAYFEDTTDGELLHGYLEYSRPYSALHLKLGRQHIFAGVTDQSVDGLQAAAGLGEILTATLFGGITSASDESSSDTTYGGRLALHPKPRYELGLSYMNTDLEGDPDHRAGLDLSFNWSDWLTLQGLSSFNLETEDWREHRYSALLRFKDAVLEPSYHAFSYQDYFGTGREETNLFHFLANTEEQVTIFGADLQLQGSGPMRLGARYNQYGYDLRQESAAYYAALLSMGLSGGSRLGVEAGRMDGETADNTYTLYRAYFFWVAPFSRSAPAFISGDGIYQAYDTPVFDEDSAVNFSLSAGFRLIDDRLALKLTGLYSQDPYFEENVEGLVTLQYQYGLE
jgi:hypothetical protein